MGKRGFRAVEFVAQKLRNTRIADVAIIQSAYQHLIQLFESTGVAGEQWIPYEGYRLRVSPPDHVSKHLVNHGYYEHDQTEVLRDNLMKGDVALDLGAHIGHHTLTMRDCVGEEGAVYAVEANPRNAALISETIAENGFENVSVVNKAVTDSSGTTELHVTHENTGAASLIESEGATEAVEVDTCRLNQLLDELDDLSVNFVKMDVQGAEREILPQLDLGSIDGMLVEIHSGEFLTPGQTREIYSGLAETGSIETVDGDSVTSFDEMDTETPTTYLWTRERTDQS